MSPSRQMDFSRNSVLEIPQNLSYADVDRVLKAIDEGTYEIKKFDRREPRTGGMNDTIDISKITSVKYDKKDDLIEVKTLRRRFAGQIYRFKINDNSITLVSAGMWFS